MNDTLRKAIRTLDAIGINGNVTQIEAKLEQITKLTAERDTLREAVRKATSILDSYHAEATWHGHLYRALKKAHDETGKA